VFLYIKNYVYQKAYEYIYIYIYIYIYNQINQELYVYLLNYEEKKSLTITKNKIEKIKRQI
jgi:hypothetical protein